ncbi:MAG: hypothetical protein Q9216_003002 [Gyalolechia sp. 2 TL-2023]
MLAFCNGTNGIEFDSGRRLLKGISFDMLFACKFLEADSSGTSLSIGTVVLGSLFAMADSKVHRQDFVLRELATQIVTLYPTRAQVVRSVKDLNLKPGSNEITIYGITPTADENSIKVEGTGAATITDMTIDLIDNREHYKDAYPSDSEQAESSDGDTEPESETEPPEVQALTSQIEELELSIKEATEERNSAQGRLSMLDNYARSLTTSRPDNIAVCVDAYQAKRAEAFVSHRNGEAHLKTHERDIRKLKDKRGKVLAKIKEKKRKADHAKNRNREKKDREKQRKISEKKRLEQERIKYWPKKVYKVVLCLETNTGLTPASSRRGSVDSLPKTPPSNVESKTDSKAPGMYKVDLSFSYITYSASWSPRYDLALETPSKSGSITYRAEFRNTTSETWRDTKVVLSTSQTSFQGLGEPLPQIQPWHIRLGKGFGQRTTDDALFSRFEQDSKNKNRGLFGQKSQMARRQLFGNSGVAGKASFGASQPSVIQSSTGLSGGSRELRSATTVPGSSGLASQGFGATQVQPNIAMPQPQHEEDEADTDQKTIAPDTTALAFEESTWEGSGLTATYTVPGTKTIAPSNTTRRHKIASIPLSSITLSHIIVPKLRTAAFLKARLRNTSSITLLKGPAGLTLDGTFLGNTSLPRSSPGEAFNLNLGVDPALNVVYNKPTVRRSESGVFQKEGSQIYTRCCTLTNTKNDVGVEATVLDQVPISEDDKLKVEVLIPRGLRKDDEKAVVRAGIGQINEGTGKKGSTYADSTSGDGQSKWGKATAKIKKEGEIEWDVRLNPGQGVKLELEYEARFPGGEGIVGV